MSSTNKTDNYELSQYIGSDKPTYLVDYNGDMLKIDTGMAANKAQADATDLVVSGHTTAIEGLQTTTGDQSDAITGLRTDVDGNTGSINTINSLIGNGEPTTTDKTLIGAINELDSDVGSLSAAVTGVENYHTVLHGSVYGGGADNVKTWAAIAKEAADALLAVVNADAYIGKKLCIDAVVASGVGAFIFSGFPINLTGSLTGFSLQGELSTVNSTDLTVRTFYFGSSNNITWKKAVVDAGGVTVSAEGSDVPASGNVTIYYRILNA